MPHNVQSRSRDRASVPRREPAQVPSHLIRSVGQFLLDGSARWPDRDWCVTPTDGVLSRSSAVDAARRVAAGLSDLGVHPGDHIVIGLPNSLDFVRAWFGAILAGVVPVAMNPKALRTELTSVYSEINARLAIVAGEDVEAAGIADAGHVITVAQLLEYAGLEEVDAAADVDTAASYLQSSGSTGRPKLIALSHRAQVLTAESFPSWLELTEDDVLLTALPLAHANAQLYSLLGSYGLGAKLILLPRFSATTFWSDVAHYDATQFNAMSAMLEILRRRPRSADEQGHHVRVCFTGPAFAEADHRDIEQRFALNLVVTYGQTEILMAGLTTEATGTTKYGASGRPRQHPVHGVINAARIVDGDGSELGDDEVGELEIWSASPTPGYLNMPAETAALFRDGWVRTGDLARRDSDGDYYITGRVKDMIRYRGENLSPLEVEAALTAHPDVSAAAVIGVPSPVSDEDVKAFVVPVPDREVVAQTLFEWCAEHLPIYKTPRYIEFVTELPLTQTNKVAKAMLSRERNIQEFDRLVG